jgi:hypothetical protein
MTEGDMDISSITTGTTGTSGLSGTTDSTESTISSLQTQVESVKADIVTGSLDALNKTGSSKSNGMSDTYNLSKDVLGAYTSGKGILANENT